MGDRVIQQFVFATIASTACLLAASAQATDTGKGKLASVSSFAQLDRNGDQRLSRSEAGFDQLLSRTFAEIDTDGNGFVTTAEFATAEKARTPVGNLTDR
jgi:hypothetical protein